MSACVYRDALIKTLVNQVDTLTQELSENFAIKSLIFKHEANYPTNTKNVGDDGNQVSQDLTNCDADPQILDPTSTSNNLSFDELYL